jgi:hypothetical protein
MFLDAAGSLYQLRRRIIFLPAVMLAAPCSQSGAPPTYTPTYALGYSHVMHNTTQHIVENRIRGTKYSGDSRQVKSIYLRSKA